MKKIVFAAASLGALLFTSVCAAQGTGGGTIYFAHYGLTYTMNSDGSNKTPLALPDSQGNPSRVLYGGHRWFLKARQISGEFYPNGAPR
nr:hypothetical protein [Armatimonadota bacterium]